MTALTGSRMPQSAVCLKYLIAPMHPSVIHLFRWCLHITLDSNAWAGCGRSEAYRQIPHLAVWRVQREEDKCNSSLSRYILCHLFCVLFWVAEGGWKTRSRRFEWPSPYWGSFYRQTPKIKMQAFGNLETMYSSLRPLVNIISGGTWIGLS